MIPRTRRRPLKDSAFPLLLTPGPLTTSAATKDVMANDWGSRDVEFIALLKSIRARLLEIAHAGPDGECVLLQGSGTFAIEAALSCFVPRDGKALVVINGAYGKACGPHSGLSRPRFERARMWRGRNPRPGRA